MKCLSIRQPWAWAIIHAGKDVENRTWAPGKALKPGERLAIHASKMFDVDGLRWICEHHKELGLDLAFVPIDPKAYPVGCVVGSVEFLGITDATDCNGRWFFGPVGWKVSNPHSLGNPIPMKGRLMLFDVDEKAVGLRRYTSIEHKEGK
jgi:hypothetical protein